MSDQEHTTSLKIKDLRIALLEMAIEGAPVVRGVEEIKSVGDDKPHIAIYTPKTQAVILLNKRGLSMAVVPKDDYVIILAEEGITGEDVRKFIYTINKLVGRHGGDIQVLMRLMFERQMRMPNAPADPLDSQSAALDFIDEIMGPMPRVQLPMTAHSPSPSKSTH